MQSRIVQKPSSKLKSYQLSTVRFCYPALTVISTVLQSSHCSATQKTCSITSPHTADGTARCLRSCPRIFQERIGGCLAIILFSCLYGVRRTPQGRADCPLQFVSPCLQLRCQGPNKLQRGNVIKPFLKASPRDGTRDTVHKNCNAGIEDQREPERKRKKIHKIQNWLLNSGTYKGFEIKKNKTFVPLVSEKIFRVDVALWFIPVQ